MKIIQSFWSRPLIYRGTKNTGWPSFEFYLMSWCLSALLLKKHYGKIELYTDDLGKELLINLLGLPYSRVDCSLNELDKYNPRYWALGKVYTYGIQDKPFLHLDNDVFLFKKFDDYFFDYELIAQNIDFNIPIYSKCLKELEQNNIVLPSFCRKVEIDSIYSANLGITGGHSIRFFEKLSNVCFGFIKNNSEFMHTLDIESMAVIYEQLFFFQLAKQLNIPINFFFNNIDSGFQDFTSFSNYKKNNFYVHLISTYKKNLKKIWHMEQQLRKEFPSYYCYFKKIIKNENYSNLLV